MATLPSQGGSDGTWGTELNTWLQLEHASTGEHSTLLAWEGDMLCWENELISWQT